MKLLNEKNITVGLITDINMHLMLEKGMRGGICNVIKRYVKLMKTHIFSI